MATNKTSFAKQFEELEKITKDFEAQDGLDLDQAVEKYERGLALAQSLKTRLDDIELRVKKIQQKYSDSTK
jgi:exodeoxyribonuclease VII small subunit